MEKFDIIYADPPWSYYNDMSVDPDCTTVKGMRRPPYPVLSVKDICSIGVKDIAADVSLLFMWSTDYHLGRAINEVMPAWGFQYKTVAFVWEKLNSKGKHVDFMGAYTKKTGCELCLLGTRGKGAHKLVKNHRVSGFLSFPRQEHSKKPDEIRNRIKSLVGDECKCLEMFARNKTVGWDIWGNELPNDVDLKVK